MEKKGQLRDLGHHDICWQIHSSGRSAWVRLVEVPSSANHDVHGPVEEYKGSELATLMHRHWMHPAAGRVSRLRMAAWYGPRQAAKCRKRSAILSWGQTGQWEALSGPIAATWHFSRANTANLKSMFSHTAQPAHLGTECVSQSPRARALQIQIMG